MKSRIKIALLGITLLALSGCATATINAAGYALDNSVGVLEENFNIALLLRQTDLTITVEDFLTQQNVTPISASEAGVMRDTLRSHKRVIEELKNYGGNRD